jgi:hypothetical protein
MVRKSKLVLVALAALVAAAIVALPAVAADPPVTGAIFTTDKDGNYVNHNIYTNKEDVYLNGGPQPQGPNHDVDCSAAGLPNGDYFFQVTDPSGAFLLSEDDIIYRQVNVTNGLITGNSGFGNHLLGNGKCDSKSVQLLPYLDTPNNGGEYKVWMTPVGSYTPDQGTFGFINSQSKTDNFKIRGSSNGTDLDVGIVGNKFYDANVNHMWDSDEPGIGGWRIYKKPPENPDETDTTSVGQIGQYSFLVAPNSGDYTITEGRPSAGFFPSSAWQPTTATSGIVTVQDTDVAGPDFGNVCLGAGGGLTLGFWSNKNGQALYTQSDQTFLQSLNLRDAKGNNFDLPSAPPKDPIGYSAYRNWLIKADATNMAYMLSAQLSAMELNVRHSSQLQTLYGSSVDGSELVYAPGVVSGSDYITVNQLMTLANNALADPNGSTVKASATRTYQEKLKIALDRANNSLNFVQPLLPGEQVPCAVPQSWVPAS